MGRLNLLVKARDVIAGQLQKLIRRLICSQFSSNGTGDA